MNRRPLQEPLNSKEHFLYCIVERLDVLIDLVEKNGVQQVAQVVAPKRSRAKKVEE